MIKFKIFQKQGQDLTVFEWQVLKAVTDIPLGQTRSYQWIAKKIGHPRAKRAVGQALNKNPFPLLVPCHRVIAQDGAIGGFAFGVRTKKKLLLLEKELTQQFCQK